MHWETYEELVKIIYEILGSQNGVKIECFGRSCKHVGKSGIFHQIDVLASHGDGLHRYYTAIECKHWDQKVSKDVIYKIARIVNDCNFDKAVVVSRKGFSDDAVTAAVNEHVHLVELDEHNISIKGETLTKLLFHTEIDHAQLTSITFHICDEESTATWARNSEDWPDYKIFRPNGSNYPLKEEVSSYLSKNLHQLSNKASSSGYVEFLPSTKILLTGIPQLLSIQGITLSAYKRQYTRLDPDYFTNKVWLLMKLVFEKKTFVYTVDGKVEQQDIGAPIEMQLGQVISFKPVIGIRKFHISPNSRLNS